MSLRFAVLLIPVALCAQPAAAPGDVTFTKDVAPVLQRSCQQCHHANGVAPMSLVTYEEVRPWAPRHQSPYTAYPHGGLMPPFFVEHDIGIQK